MGAISHPDSLPVLRRYLDHPVDAIRETAEIAVAKIEWDNSPEGRAAGPKYAPLRCPISLSTPRLTFRFSPRSAFNTIDPAPASNHSPLASSTYKSTQSVEQLQRTLNDTSLSLFERYRAMFALRNDGGKEAVLALATGFGDSSALFRSACSHPLWL